jgi:hypothetical protein
MPDPPPLAAPFRSPDHPSLLPEVATASDACQRWNHRRPRWRRLSDALFEPARYAVYPLRGDRLARSFVTQHHYSGTYPAAVHRYGLIERFGGVEILAGVAVFAVPMSKPVLTKAFPTLRPYGESVELARFVLMDYCAANAESWFLARCFHDLARHGVRGVVAFADPVPRHTFNGTTVLIGRVGTIYQATNALYAGRSTARTITILGDGTVLTDRAVQKVRRQELGHLYVQRRLLALGASPPAPGEDPTAWLALALTKVSAYRVRHGGCHRYVWRLGRGADSIELGLPLLAYPKTRDPVPRRPG